MRRLVLCLASLLAVVYCTYVTVRIRQLEARLQHELSARHAEAAPLHLTCAFDDSFRQHFGERGVAIVEAAVIRGVTDPDEILRDLRQEYAVRYDVR